MRSLKSLEKEAIDVFKFWSKSEKQWSNSDMTTIRFNDITEITDTKLNALNRKIRELGGKTVMR